MSSRELDDIMEDRQADAVAEALGISREDLAALEWRMEDHTSSDGLLYGHIIYFEDESDSEVLARVPGLQDGNWVRIGPLPNGEQPPDDEY